MLWNEAAVARVVFNLVILNAHSFGTRALGFDSVSLIAAFF